MFRACVGELSSRESDILSFKQTSFLGTGGAQVSDNLLLGRMLWIATNRLSSDRKTVDPFEQDGMTT